MQCRGLRGQEPPLSLEALDAAISHAIGKPVRRDRLARDDRVYRWVIRRVAREGSTFRTTYAEAARGAGYDVAPLKTRAARRRAKERRVSTIRRALGSLQEAGLLEFRGCLKENGQWRCLEIRLDPSARGRAPHGRSGRRPQRRPGHRVSFLSQSGYSPAELPAGDKTQKRVPSRARAREGSNAPAKARRTRGSPRSQRRTLRLGEDWPLDSFELRDQALVELCDVFEASFGRPAHFSFRQHGERLRRVLARFDRFTGRAGASERSDGRPGPGLREAKTLVQELAREAKAGVPSAKRINSLAWFVPVLDQASKERRRWWKAHYGPRWA